MNQIQAELNAEKIIQLLLMRGGEEYAGEKVTQLQHMYQAGELARKKGYSDVMILAAFLHDIGHIIETESDENGMHGWGIKNHETKGGDFLLSLGCSSELAELVASHVEAKRYLTSKDRFYYESLSEASKKTLEYQGGLMDYHELIAFETDPLFNKKVQLRLLDDEAKDTDWLTGSLHFYKNLLIRHLSTEPS